jgi:hypothetical protein
MRHVTFRALAVGSAVGIGLLAAAAPARAGSVFVSRQTSLRAAGSNGDGDYNVADGTLDAGPFQGSVASDPDFGEAQSSGAQTSRPTVIAGVLTAALFEGTAQARVERGSFAGSVAESNFDLTFDVVGDPVVFHVSGTIGVASDALIMARMVNPQTTEPIFSHEVQGEVVRSGSSPNEPDLGADPAAPELSVAPGFADATRRKIDASGVLVPGRYWISVLAAARGTPEESQAAYHLNLRLDPVRGETSGPPPQPIPLPPAVWTGLSAMIALGGARLWTRRRELIG